MAYCNRKYTKEVLQLAVTGSLSMAETMRKLGIKYLSGGMQTHIKRRIEMCGISTDHFLGQGRNRGESHVGGPARLTAKEIFVYNRRGGYRETAKRLRRALDEIGRKRVCIACGVGELWRGTPLVLEVNHKDGDALNNVADNLEYLCPNCHSQIPSKAGPVAGVAQLA